MGSLLQRARKARNWSIRRAAKEAGVDDATWRQLEEGERKVRGEKVPASPRDDTLANVARAVGLDPAVVFEAAEREYVAPADGPLPPMTATDQAFAELRSELEKLRDEVQELRDSQRS